MTAPANPKPKPLISLSGRLLLLGAVPAALLLALTFHPRFRDNPPLTTHLAVAAGFLLVWLALVAARSLRRREPLRVEVLARRPHYLQMISQGGVYVYWGSYWAPVAQYAPMIAAQLLFVYTVDALYAWSRKRPWVLGFAPVPVVFSTNLFLWFRDEYFLIQLALVAFGILSKDLFRWRRNGVQRHIFNPSSIALALASIVLLATGTTELTFARQIAQTQDLPPYIHEVLFLLGLIVQLNFPVVLVTMSSVVTVVLLGALHHAATGLYMFSTTSVPAAVLLGSLLLVTDPATSPENKAGKILFGASYGALVFASFPLLERFGHFGYFDKLLPVPFLNLLVPSFDRAGAWISKTAGRLWTSNFINVGIWAAVFLLLRVTHAVGHEHPGRSLEFWADHCIAGKSGACQRLHSFCAADEWVACHNFGLLIADGKVRWTRYPASFYLVSSCYAGHIAPSCGRLGDIYRRGDEGKINLVLARDMYRRGCGGGEGLSCYNLGVMHQHGLGGAADLDAAVQLYRKACDKGVPEGCAASNF